MKTIIRYLLEGDGTIPKFVEDGGYFQRNEQTIGVSVDSTKRHIPATVVVLTNQELIDWVKATENTLKNAQELEDIANAWLTEKGFQ